MWNTNISQKMFRFSFRIRRLSQRSATVTLGPVRYQMASDPYHLISAASISSSYPVPQSHQVFTQKRSLGTGGKGPKSESEALKIANRKIYTNRHGEEIMFSPCDPPPVYMSVPSGNVFVTGRCRRLARTVYAVYRPGSRRKQTAQLGLYVPKEISTRVESEYKTRRARMMAKIWQALAKNYPRMPLADRSEVQHLISSRYPTVIGNSALDHILVMVHTYVRDRHTRFKSLDIYNEKNTEAIAQAHKRVQEILADWRGEH